MSLRGFDWPAGGMTIGDRHVEVARAELRDDIVIDVRQRPRALEVVPGLTITRPENAARLTTDARVLRARPQALRDRVAECLGWLDAGELAVSMDIALWRANA